MSSLASWVPALTLAERFSCPNGDKPALASCVQAAKAVERWKSQYPFANGVDFERRLALNGITELDLISVLAESAEALAFRVRDYPEWSRRIEQWFGSSNHGRTSEDFSDFSWFIAPINDWVATELKARLEGHDCVNRAQFGDIDRIVGMCVRGLIPRLVSMVSRVLVLELNIARLEGRLRGDTPEKRFQSFAEDLCETQNALLLLRQYPVLARKLVETVDQNLIFNQELFVRLATDWDLVRQILLGPNPGAIIQICPSLGDFHRKGRTVTSITFERGQKLIYKPRSVAAEGEFQNVLRWMNGTGWEHPFRPLRVIDRTGYGWMEFIESAPCTEREEVSRFYFRQGGYLALLYALHATDIHFENVVASGEHPMLVDLETICQPRLVQFASIDRSFVAVEESVLRVGLLPQRIWFGDGSDQDSVDISGLGGQSGQQSPFPVLGLERQKADELRIISRRVPLSEQVNRPTLGGDALDSGQYLDELLAGFTSAYRTIEHSRDRFMGLNGPFSALAQLRLRLVLRPTRLYGNLVRDSFHPDMLRSGLRREQLLDVLWSGTEKWPELVGAAQAERADIDSGDIPFFEFMPNSLSIWTANGQELANVFSVMALEKVQSRISFFSEADLIRQLWFITASFKAAFKDTSDSSHVQQKQYFPLREARAVTAARAIADRLCILAHEVESEMWWATAEPQQEDVPTWTVKPTGIDLYGGLPGVVLFLAYAGLITKDETYIRVAQTAFRTLTRSISETQMGTEQNPKIGAFDGVGGWLYVMMHVALLWRDPTCLELAPGLLAALGTAINNDDALDVVSGVAGLIPILLSLGRLKILPEAVHMASRCADHLCNRAVKQDAGIAWVTTMSASQPLTGFSHGAAGIAWALNEISSATCDIKFRHVAINALEYERKTFSVEHDNWPDYRTVLWRDAIAAHYGPAYWCHGAAGIALARIKMLCTSPQLEVKEDIENALRITRQTGFGHNHSLCHGDLGNLEVLTSASAMKENANCFGENKILHDIITSVLEGRWTCGTFKHIETPGLMNGLAGIGLGLLRATHPGEVPCVLTLQGPTVGL